MSATSESSALPACDTNPAPSAVTSTVTNRPSRITRKVNPQLGIQDFGNPKNPCCAGRSRAPGHPEGAGLTARSGLAPDERFAVNSLVDLGPGGGA